MVFYRWSLQTDSFSTCFNEKPFLRETKKCGRCRQVVIKAGLTVAHEYTEHNVQLGQDHDASVSCRPRDVILIL